MTTAPLSPPSRDSDPLRIDRSTKKALDYASKIELGEIEDEIAFTARVWAQVALPYREPQAGLSYWERRNGNVSLMMRPALMPDPRSPGGERVERYPFGSYPRQVLTWMATEAVRNHSNTIELGHSMSSFMARLGINKGGREAARLVDQMKRLFGSVLTVEGIFTSDDGRGEVLRNFQFADGYQLWFNRDNDLDELNQGLWSSTVTLNDKFYQSIIQAPVPIWFGAMEQLKQSPLALDIYFWATHRVYRLQEPIRITWTQLEQQFGGQYRERRMFKRAFLEALKKVLIVYPDLRVRVETNFLMLLPSPTSVPRKVAAKLIAS